MNGVFDRAFRVEPAGPGFIGWDPLMALLHRAFRDMEGRIDPPSSLLSTTATDLARRAAFGHLVLARTPDGALLGCGFGTRAGDALYLSKLAVDPDWQRRGLLRAIVAELEKAARQDGLSALTLETRVELTGNHAAFRALGFDLAGETRHPGYDRTTSLTFAKPLA